MRAVSWCRWTVYRIGVIIMAAAPSVLCADDPSDSFPAVPRPVFGDATDVATANAPARETVKRLLALTEQTSDPLLRTELRLSAANVILSEQLEWSCTQRFWLQTDATTEVSDVEGLRSAFDDAARMMADAETDLDVARQALADAEAADHDEAGKDEADTAVKRYTDASRTRRALAAFHQALQVALLPPDGDDTERASRQAASELSALREHDDARVATAASFWQAFLRRGESDATAALSRLSFALDDIPASGKPYAFFSRVLRCLVLSAHDRRFAALTLLTQMEERIFGWFSDDAERDQAMRAVIWTRVHLLRQWHDSLDAKTQSDERRWCRERAATLIETKLNEPFALPRLKPAIPMLIEPQKLEAEVAGSE